MPIPIELIIETVTLVVASWRMHQVPIDINYVAKRVLTLNKKQSEQNELFEFSKNKKL